MRVIATVIVVILALATIANASEDLGVVGKTYEIRETSLLDHIQAQLREMERDGRLQEQQQLMRKRVEATVQRPPGRVLPRAQESSFYHHDPSVVTDFDVTDQAGNVVYMAGTRVNPLDYAPLSTPLVFFDGDDLVQRIWVRQLLGDTPERYVTLVTNGPVIELMQDWQVRLYFDQHGQYSEQLGITALPAVVRQEGAFLRVDQIAVEDM